MAVIYNVVTERVVKTTDTLRGARIAVTRKYNDGNHVALESRDAIPEPTMVKVTNLMTGKEVLIEKKDVGGVCDPSTERYWSM